MWAISGLWLVGFRIDAMFGDVFGLCSGWKAEPVVVMISGELRMDGCSSWCAASRRYALAECIESVSIFCRTQNARSLSFQQKVQSGVGKNHYLVEGLDFSARVMPCLCFQAKSI